METTSQAADSSEGIVKSPTESIFSDDDDIWFEASDQLTDELRVPTASPPLTPTTEDEGKLEVLTFINPGPPPPLTPPEAEKGIEGELPKLERERELNPDHGTEQLLGREDENDRTIGYQDRIGTSTCCTSTETENVESDFRPVIVQDDGGPTEHAQNTDDIIEDAPHEIDIFLDVHPDEVTVAAVEMVEEDSQFLAAQDSNIVPINTQGNEAVVHVLSVQSEVYLAEALVKELRRQQKMAEACKMEAKYVEVCTAAMIKDSVPAEGEAISMENDGMGMGPPEVVEPPADRDGIGSELDKIPPVSTAPLDEPTLCVPLHSKKQPKDKQRQQQLDADISVPAHNSEVYLAESLVRELKTQQRLVECCRAQSRYMEMMCATSVAMTTSKEPAVASVVHVVSEFTEENDFGGAEMEGGGEKMKCDSLEATTLTAATVLDSEPTEHVQKNVELESNSDKLQVFEIPQQLESIPGAFLAGPKVAVCDASTNTDPTDTCTQSTNTITPEFSSQGVNTDPLPVAKEIGCNTMLNCFDVLQRAKEMDELQFLKVEHQIAVRQMNEAKSQKMVAEQLTKIVQSDLVELRQQNLTETTRRLQLENDLSDAKIELSQTTSELKEKAERVQELEDSLSGTALLVRKLEEQSAVSLMSRGGIDYMLQAKLADGRAQEAEQKLEVVQSELLQAQAEVRRLLDRVAEASRDRSEMVSSRVHTQLIQIADERAQAAERRSLQLEREIQDMRGRLSVYEASGIMSGGAMGGGAMGGQLTGSSFSTLSGLGGGSYSTSSMLGSTYSPFSYTTGAMTTKPLSLSEQYNIHSDLAPPTFSSSATPTPFTSSFLRGQSSGASSRPLGSGAIYSNDDIGGLSKASGVSGILKPSQMFKKHGDGSHDPAVNGSHTHSSHVTSSESADGENIKLPSFEATPTKPPSPTKVKFSEGVESSKPISIITRGNENDGGGGDNDSESSDWSSSASDGEGGEEREGGGGGGGGGGGMKPSHHTNLIAEWEWRTMADTTDTSSAHPPSSGSPLTKRRVPPPVAPKPHGIFKPSSMTAAPGGSGGATMAAAAHYERAVQFEPSSSFDVPTHSAAIQGLRRPRGPRGRSLPSRYHGQQLVI